MDRLIASNSVPLAQADTAPTTGTPQYATDGNPATNVPATLWPAYAFNALQDEIYNVIIAAGLTPNRNAWNQLLTAIQSMLQGSTTNVGVDTGAANAYVVAFTPALPNPVPWVPFWFEVAHTNTGTSTLNATGTVEPLVGGAHLALQGGEMVAKGNALVYWNPTLNSNAGAYVLLFCSGAPEQIAPATASEHAVQLGQLTAVGINPGRLLRTSVYYNNGGTLFLSVNGAAFAAAGSSTFTALAATQGVDVELIGGGGGSGGSGATTSTQITGAGGGGEGAYARGYYTSGFSGVTITCGAAGAAAVAGGNGGAGGSSSFGTLLTTPGGGGSTGGTVVASTGVTLIAGGGGGGGVPTGTYYIARAGQQGAYASGSNGTLFTGQGGGFMLGAGGQGKSSGAGSAASGFGAGGGGAGAGTSTAAAVGGAGAPGAVIIREYA